MREGTARIYYSSQGPTFSRRRGPTPGAGLKAAARDRSGRADAASALAAGAPPAFGAHPAQ